MATTVRGTRPRKAARATKARLRKADRTLVVIGGHEDKEGDRAILREVAALRLAQAEEGAPAR